MCSDDSNGDEGGKPVVHTLLGRTVYVLGEMYHAALTPEEVQQEVECGESDTDEHTSVGGKHRRRRRRRRRTRHRHSTAPTKIVCNGGGMDLSPSTNHAILQLAKRYDIDLSTDKESHQLPKKYESILPSSHTTLNEALQIANSNARFLICYISKQQQSINKVAITNLLSEEFVKVTNRRPLGKKQTGESASYYVWITNDDKDVEGAMKRLKVKPPSSSGRSKRKGVKKSKAAPILAIIYPATTIDPSGRLKVTPRILAQHHCHPPPSTPETLIAWANAIRKRHLREYAKLQHDRKELQLLKERTEGYESSVKEDKEREKREEMEEQKKREEEEEERLRLEEMERRREGLLQSLADEPEAGAVGVITIALRFTGGKFDGKRDQRRFIAKETMMNDVFDWIDAVHGVERERVELSTMNGSRQFRYIKENNDENGESDEEGGEASMTLEEAGLGRMTALRVSEIEAVQEEDQESSDDEKEEESDEESDE